jgi:L,D-transpeptidase YcbB
VVLTSAYAILGDDLLTGQHDPRAISSSWRIDTRTIDVDSALARTLRLEPLDRAIAHLRPQSSGYAELRERLAEYRTIVAKGGWPAVPEGKALKPGDTSSVERLRALHDRLRAEQHLTSDLTLTLLAEDSSRAVYDERLAGGIANFQARHAIVVDSILGGETLASLNRPAEYRLGQIAANLERHRWLPREMGERYIFVNVPAFRLDAFEGGRSVLDMRVIVGAEYRDQATPAFADSMSYLEFYPYWNVPENIANNELWPRIAADPGYLERNHYEVVSDGDGQRIRQRPGSHNALGRVKFMFPNQYNIYLHHTPQEELFERDVRALSHGCIRVEKPVELAEYVLSGQAAWTHEEIRAAMNGPTRQVQLEQKLPVFIVYFTAFVRDGMMHFGNDVYDSDAAVVRAVAGGAQPSPELEQQLADLRKSVGGNLIDRLRSMAAR